MSRNGAGGDRTAATGRISGPSLGAVEWFCPGEHERVEQVLEAMRQAGIERLRTGVSWADCHTPAGRAWYEWLLPRLALEIELLPCFTYTPPPLGVVTKSSAPPRDPKAYADFLDTMITAHGRHFEWLELWNGPNNLNDWDRRLDPQWLIFSEMVGAAAYGAQRRGKRTVLGGMYPSAPNWLALMAKRGVLGHVDAVGVHAFPESWDQDWQGWPSLVAEIRAVLRRFGLEPQLWATAVGYSTWRNDEGRQIPCLLHGLDAPLERFYWYALQDLAPERATQQGFHVDERHCHFGLIRADGTPKLVHRLLAAGGIEAVRTTARLAAPALARSEPRTVVTGGAGFVGSNLADRLARQGERVLVYDSLARPGVEANAAWLKQRYGASVQIEAADVRDPYALRDAVRWASSVYHFAAQVAVTTSLEDPSADFEVNVRGTMNLLEALRRRSNPPPVLFTSTNKVYGGLEGLGLEACTSRYAPADAALAAFGIAETQPLDFCSPYGCSKGAADQYVLDYARSFGLPATVFRMSCIYGPRQLGTEDQGWVAHFLRAALCGEPITIYGDGRQVRDLLYVDDLIEALLLARARIGDVAGHAFNVGGGPGNAVSLLEVLRVIERLNGKAPDVALAPWRPADQLYYVSDTRAFRARTGWRARIDVETGLARLWQWLRAQRRPVPVAKPLMERVA
jgi:CDP-paratose 2-epimerase